MSARWALMPDVPDVCGMPVGFDQNCYLDGDHAGGCLAPTPRCLCSHARHKGQCFSAACGCREFREKKDEQ